MDDQIGKRILRLRQVEAKTGLRHSAIYARMAAGEFPKSFSLGAKAMGWLESEVDSWIDQQAARASGPRPERGPKRTGGV